VNYLAQVNPRDEFLGVVRWRRNQLEKLSVDVRLGTEVDRTLVESMGPDVVIVATGAQQRVNGWYPPLVSTIPGGDLPHVMTVTDVLSGRADDAKRAVVVDELGYHQSSDALDYLVALGAETHGVTSAGAFAADMLLVDRTLWLKSLNGKDVVFHPTTIVREITPTSVHLQDVSTGAPLDLVAVDTVVLSLGADVSDGLFKELEGLVDDLHIIGDARTPRRIEQAVHEGHRVGRIV
jgi:thioredoxin reductase